VEISASMVKELRDRTGAGMMDCKAALAESSGDVDKALEFLRVKGLAKAAKKSGRETTEGTVMSYIHPGSRIGVLVQVDCETDFVARTDDFQGFVRDVAMQVAATNPVSVDRSGVSEEKLEAEREVSRKQATEAGKPENIVDKIIDGRIEKYYKEVVLLDQAYIKDDSKTVSDLVNEIVSKLGENIKIARFARFEIGQ